MTDLEKYVNIDPGFPDHHKVRKLNRLSGTREGAYWLLRLWGTVHKRRSQQFSDDADEIAGVCQFDGDPEQFVGWLVQCRLLEKKEAGYWARDFEQWNGPLVAHWESGKKGGRPKLGEPNKTKTAIRLNQNHDLVHNQLTNQLTNNPEDPARAGARDPNTFVPPRHRSNLIDPKKPPFTQAGHFQREDVQHAIKALLRYQEEKHGRQYTRLEFQALMVRFEQVRKPERILQIIADCMSKGYKNPVFPDQEPYK